MTTTKTTITVETPRSGTLTLVVEGAEWSAAEDFASVLLDIARQGFATIYTSSFDEAVLDLLEWRFEERQREAAAETEYDMGYRIGVEAGKKHSPGVLGYQRITVKPNELPAVGDVIVTLPSYGLDGENDLIVDRPVREEPLAEWEKELLQPGSTSLSKPNPDEDDLDGHLDSTTRSLVGLPWWRS